MAEMKELRTALEEGTKKGYSSEEIVESFIEFLNGLPSKDQAKEIHKEISEDELIYEVTNVMIELGTPASIKGYYYIREAILYCLKNKMDGITKTLYPYIAKEYSTTSSRVERAIRHAIEVTWEKGNEDVIKKYFGNTLTLQKKPTNSEFIAMITDKIKLRYKLS